MLQYTIVKLKLFVVTVVTLIFITSCTVPQSSVSYDIQQNIYVNNLEKTTLEGTEKKYHIYKLPYLPKTNYASLLQLSVILNNVEDSKLEDGYFAVIVNASENEENISNYIQKYTHGESYFRHHQPFTVEKKTSVSSSTHKYKTQQNLQDEYDQLCAVTRNEDEDPKIDSCEPSTRKFLYGYSGKSSTTQTNAELYKKFDFYHEGQHLYFALWVKNGQTLDSLDLNQKNFTSLYKKLYAINDNHIWGPHNFEDYAIGDSIIHIAFGNIRNERQRSDENILGFVDPRTFFYNINTPNYVPEEITAPTIYISYPNKKKKYISTLIHELQHVFIYYRKVMQQSSSAHALTNGVDTWIGETLSVATQYLMGKFILKKETRKKNISDSEYIRDVYNEWYKKSDETLREASLTDNDNFNASSYKVSYMLASYLIQNYGIEVITHALKNAHRNSYALVQAAKDSAKYWDIPEHLRPKTIEDILVQFFTSIFTSDIVQNLDNTLHNYKFFTKNPDHQSPILKLTSKHFKHVIMTVENENYKIADEEIPIVSTSITPARIIRKNNIIFEVKSQNSKNPSHTLQPGKHGIGNNIITEVKSYENPSYTLQHGKHGIAYLGGRLSRKNNSKKGAFKTNEEGHPYFTINLKRGSIANLVIVEHVE